MCCCSCEDSKKPSECDDKPCCPEMEIEINDTPATDDDLVGLKCDHPGRRPTTDCRIRAIGGPCCDATVVLTNPDGRLRFHGPTDTTTTLTLPKDGSWVSFKISGESGSAAIGDAKIEAHCDTATGTLKTSKDVTVFWFDQAKLDITVGGSYSLTGTRFTVVGAHAVDYEAEARIRPPGVNCGAPQVTNLRIGIMQNTFPPRIRMTNWDSPAITWNPGVATGTTVTAANVMRETKNVTVTANDSEATVAPLYDQPGKSGTLDSDSLKPPKGCPGGAAATSFDTPSRPTPPTFTTPALTPAGANVGTITYTFVNVTHRDNFRAWTAVFNTSTNDFCTLRERIWKTDMDSAATTPQHPTVEAETGPTTTPVTAAPFSNAHSNNPANRTLGPAGAATTTFTK